MKKRKVYILFVVVIGFTLVGCSDAIFSKDNYKNDDSVVRTSGVIKYNDGTSMGTTRAEPQVNGGFQIYHIGTGEVIGFIRLDGQVNDKAGRNLGICAGSAVSDNGLAGNCTLPIANPNQVSIQEAAPIQPPASLSPCSQSFTTTPSDCEDRRDGTFDVSWNRPTCEQHGYFYCTLNNICTDQTVNINQCLGR